MPTNQGMMALVWVLLLVAPPQDPSVPNPDPTEPESIFELSMPGEQPSEALGERPPEGMALWATGTVVAIDAEQVRLRRRGHIDAEMRLEADTQFVLDGESVTFDEIPVGSRAEVVFVLRGAERVVLELRAWRR
ncbi:MAG TPA: hypothetical protein VKY51_07085 [Fredinandcohnia sp.]|nr:hypothetical protein [Fredinandcohnia sp.]